MAFGLIRARLTFDNELSANSWRSEKGYTLVESVVASALLLSVLIPASLMVGKLAMSRHNQALIIATELARTEMETAMSLPEIRDEQKMVRLGSQQWRVVRKINQERGLHEIEISIYAAKGKRRLARLQALRHIRLSFDFRVR